MWFDVVGLAKNCQDSDLWFFLFVIYVCDPLNLFSIERTAITRFVWVMKMALSLHGTELISTLLHFLILS
jgi:hypothetical protein